MFLNILLLLEMTET